MESIERENDSRSVSRRFPVKLLVLAGVAVVLLFPYQTTVVPEWKIRVVDENGRPFAGARVRQQWHHYSYDVHDGDDQTTDENGYVIFPERTFTAPLLYRVLRSALAYVMILAHGGTGVRAYVWALSETSSTGLMDYKPGMPLVQEIVLRR